MADFDTELLISSVEERPYLWNAAHKDYKDRDVRLKGWQEIAAAIVPGYEDLQEADQNKSVTMVQTRWKTARDAYNRSRNKLAKTKSGSGASRAVKYTYHDQLNFLGRVLKGPTESNFAADVDSQDSIGTQPDDKEEDESLAGIDLNESSREEANATGNFKRKKRTKNSEFEDSLITLLKDSKDKEDDDDRAFLTSLLPSLKLFNADQKLMFRSQVLQLIMSIRQNSAAALMPPQFPNAHFNYGPQYGPSTSTPTTYPANFYPTQNRNPFRFSPYPQGDYHPSSTATTPLPSPRVASPAPSTVSTASWETL